MPKIIGQEERLRALKDVVSALKEVEALNKFIAAANPEGFYTISFVDADGVKHSCKVRSSDKTQVDLLVLNHKEEIRSRIMPLTQQHQIELDPEDQAILN